MKREVIKKILDLSETMDEGMAYVRSKVDLLEIENTLTVIADLIAAFNEIERSLLKEESYVGLKETSEQLKRAFNRMVTDLECQNRW